MHSFTHGHSNAHTLFLDYLFNNKRIEGQIFQNVIDDIRPLIEKEEEDFDIYFTGHRYVDDDITFQLRCTRSWHTVYLICPFLNPIASVAHSPR